MSTETVTPRRGGGAMTRAIDLVGGHSWACVDHGHGSCICDYAERQQAARDIDARVAKLESVARQAALLLHDLSDEVQDDDPDLADEIDALLSKVP